jgi:hypothetical protein
MTPVRQSIDVAEQEAAPDQHDDAAAADPRRQVAKSAG